MNSDDDSRERHENTSADKDMREARPATKALKSVLAGLLLSAVTLAVMAVGGEVFLRERAPSFKTEWPVVFDPAIGYRFQPGAEVATTNNLDYWNRQRANSLGFLDREPVPPEQRPGSCHLVLIGDSFVEAHQVDIKDKAQVLLEQMAAQKHPELKLTTAGFGISDTGQINQLPYYDLFARRQAPRIVVLVFVKNDFSDNSALIQAVNHAHDPAHQNKLFARRKPDGGFELQPIEPDWQKYVLAPPPDAEGSGGVRAWLRNNSGLYRWTEDLAWRGRLFVARWWYGPSAAAFGSDRIVYNAHLLAQRPQWAALLGSWDVEKTPAIDEVYFDADIAPIFQEAVAFTGFALDQFQERSRRDGFHLIILATQTMRRDDGSGAAFDRLARLAAARDIPVIDLYEHIRSHGGRVADARLRYDGHWSPQGHRWAAEAVLDYVGAHPALCR